MKNVKKSIEWYADKIPIYQTLARKIEDIIRENLTQNQIQVHSITSRVKSLDSYSTKAKKEKYKNPMEEIKDMAGIRVITYLENDVGKASQIVEGLFNVIPEDSIDQSKLLGSDRVGYRSVHYVAILGKDRCKLPEYKIYDKLPFEIQIRSLLQHTWAEIEHDRNYKFSGKLPTELERRFYLVAGMLEVADNEFTSIAQEIEKYRNEVVDELVKGELNIEINTTSLREYLSKKFRGMIEEDLLIPNFGADDNLSKVLVEELRLFGISKLYELDRIVPENYQENAAAIPEFWNNFAGLIRDILMINNAKRYFEVSWKEQWNSIDINDLAILKKYKVDKSILEKYISIDQWIEPHPE